VVFAPLLLYFRLLGDQSFNLIFDIYSLKDSAKGGKKKSPKKKAAVPEAVDMAATARALNGDNDDSSSDSDSWGRPQYARTRTDFFLFFPLALIPFILLD
jgi:hypothetical protein